jgi:hypothetical protein
MDDLPAVAWVATARGREDAVKAGEETLVAMERAALKTAAFFLAARSALRFKTLT